MSLRLDGIRDCFEGAIPGVICTVAADGLPNIAYLPQLLFIDNGHLASPYQFAGQTRQNLLADPRAQLVVTHPVTMAQYRISLEFVRTETDGPLFECMQAKLAGIASHTGMSGVSRLLGSDIFQVIELEAVPGPTLPPAPPRLNMWSALRTCFEVIGESHDLERLLNGTLIVLQTLFDIQHSMILMFDEPHGRLYTVASRGYDVSGIGSEIPLGQGVIGVAAREKTPIRISHMNAEYAYSRAMREQTLQSELAAALELEIPLPGLHESRSQLAVPIIGPHGLLGMIYVESPLDLRFTYDDEDALVMLAAQLGMKIPQLQTSAEAGEEAVAAAASAPDLEGAPMVVRHYPENDSIFLDDDYLIKGVAGSIFLTLVGDFIEKNRSEFTNRELRLDPRVKLPDLSDNLEARLLLLSRRLVERNACMRIEKTGRGRFKLVTTRPLKLVNAGSTR